MSNQQQSHRQHQPNDHLAYQERQRPGNPQEHRREFLWRERVKLEMQVQALLALLQSLEQEYCMLQQRKASMEQEKPKLAAQIVLSGLTGTRSLPSERLYHARRGATRAGDDPLSERPGWPARADRGHSSRALFPQLVRSNVTLL